MDEIYENYEKTVLNNLKIENFQKIIEFLKEEKCNYIDEIIERYLDLLTIEHNDFINRYYILNKKYNGSFLELASEDMNLLEEFYN